MPRTVWSIGLAREVEVIGHGPNPDTDVFLVSTDSDGDGSPDHAVQRYGSDLVPNFTIGSAVSMIVMDGDREVPATAVVSSRSYRGLYVHSPLTLQSGAGALLLPWESIRERVEEGSFGFDTSLTGQMVAGLWRLKEAVTRERGEANEEVARLRSEHEAFKATVGVVAKRLAEEHEWCDTVRDAVVDELGCPWPTSRYSVQVRLKGSVEVEASSEDEAKQRALYVIDGIAHSGDDFDYSVEMYEKDTRDVEALD